MTTTTTTTTSIALRCGWADWKRVWGRPNQILQTRVQMGVKGPWHFPTWVQYAVRDNLMCGKPEIKVRYQSVSSGAASGTRQISAVMRRKRNKETCCCCWAVMAVMVVVADWYKIIINNSAHACLSRCHCHRRQQHHYQDQALRAHYWRARQPPLASGKEAHPL